MKKLMDGKMQNQKTYFPSMTSVAVRYSTLRNSTVRHDTYLFSKLLSPFALRAPLLYLSQPVDDEYSFALMQHTHTHRDTHTHTHTHSKRSKTTTS